MQDEANNSEPVLLTTPQAAKLLQVSEKTLWNHTKPRGNNIPAIRFGKTVRYDRGALLRWIAQQNGANENDASG